MRDVNDYCPKIVTILGSYVASVDSLRLSWGKPPPHTLPP